MFDFEDEPSTLLICQQVLTETISKMSSLENLVPGTQVPAICYEFNDVRPIRKRTLPKHAETRRGAEGYHHIYAADDFGLGTELFVLINQFSDGYQLYARFDESKFEHGWMECFCREWVLMWDDVNCFF